MSISARKLQRISHGSGGGTPSANLYVTPASGTYGYGATVTVQVYEDSGSTSVNGVQFDLTYPTAQLQYVSSNNSGSPFSAVLQNSGGSGTVNIAVGNLGGSASGAQLVATIIFKVIATGSANLAFGNNCFVTETSTSSNILSGKTGSSYTCVPGAALSLNPASGSYSNGATVTVSIYEDSGATAVNGVEAYLTYPTAQLQYVSSDNNGSPFATLIQHTGGSGTVHIAVGNLGGSSTGSQLAGTITFTAVGTGTANIAFTNGCLVTQESNSADILSATTGSSYTIT